MRHERTSGLLFLSHVRPVFVAASVSPVTKGSPTARRQTERSTRRTPARPRPSPGTPSRLPVRKRRWEAILQARRKAGNTPPPPRLLFLKLWLCGRWCMWLPLPVSSAPSPSCCVFCVPFPFASHPHFLSGERVIRVLLPAARRVRAAVHDLFGRVLSLPGAGTGRGERSGAEADRQRSREVCLWLRGIQRLVQRW